MRRREREVTDKAEIAEVLEKSDACRIAFAVDNRPYIVCLNYGYEWEGEYPVLYFHCAHDGMKIDMMERNNNVCFQIDTDHELFYIPDKVYCTMGYASITGWGKLEKVTNENEIKKGLDLLMEHHLRDIPEAYPEHSMKRTTVLRLEVTELSAKKNNVRTT